MSVIKVYRIQNSLTGLGMYATKTGCIQLDGADEKVKRAIRWVKDELERTYDETLQPDPNRDYELTFGTDPIDDRLEKREDRPHEQFYSFRHCDTTFYGCKSPEFIFNVWLSENPEYIENFVDGLYQLIEVAIDEADCFVMKNQIMYNKDRVIAIEILDLDEVFTRILKEQRRAA